MIVQLFEQTRHLGVGLELDGEAESVKVRTFKGQIPYFIESQLRILWVGKSKLGGGSDLFTRTVLDLS